MNMFIDEMGLKERAPEERADLSQDEQEVNDLMDVLRNFYAQRLEKEMLRLWDDGTLDHKQLEVLRGEHLRTPYRV